MNNNRQDEVIGLKDIKQSNDLAAKISFLEMAIEEGAEEERDETQ